MQKLIQRFTSFFASPIYAKGKIEDLMIELKMRGIDFEIAQVQEDGQTYLYAKSVNYPRGIISATGKDPNELETELKDAMFTAFEVPARYADPNLINFNPALTQRTAKAVQAVHATR